MELKGRVNLALSKYKKEELKEMPMIEITYELMKTEKQTFLFKDLIKRVAKLKGMNESEVTDRISYLYTDLNIDGRFISLGENRWGLRTWYPYDESDEEITQTVRRKKAKKAADDKAALDLNAGFDDIDEDLEDEFEDLEDELDELVSEEDDDDEDVDDKDIDLDDVVAGVDTDKDDDEDDDEDEDDKKL
ncbi:DNA-directed RNA polymerase subunit delta [Bacillaceae bacterium IKA-2]|jgi:DNA-directed RNA polymerase subunit delta|nr:DNA-directed RNA polymerase subunit delta [Bacillaceae bacterium IKA-2]